MDRPGEEPFSIGAQPPPEGLQCPDSHTAGRLDPKNRGKYRLAKVFDTTPEQDAAFIDFLKDHLRIDKEAMARSGGKRSPYYEIGRTPDKLKMVPNKTKVCTTTATWFLREGQIDPNAPDDRVSPNALWNHYNPGKSQLPVEGFVPGIPEGY